MGSEDMGGWTIFPPTSMHGEAEYNFFETYKINFSDKMQNYGLLIEKMKRMRKEEEDKIRKKIERKIQEEEEFERKVKKEKEEKNFKIEDISQYKNEIKELKDKNKREMIEKCYKMFNEGKKYREIGRELELNHITVKKYIRIYEKEL